MTNRIHNIRKWLLSIAIIHIIGGFLVPLIVNTPIMEIYVNHVSTAFNSPNAADSQQARFLISLLGPTIASWGLLFFYTIDSSFANPSPKAWWFMIMACLL